MSHSLAFTAITGHGDRPLSAAIDRLIIAGWTGRDAAAVEAHIEELARLGVARPKTTPIFYQVAAHLLTTGGAIEVAGPDTSGEVEPVVVSLADGLWVGVGSDHTDRVMEAQGVTLSKQLCAKPVSSELWPYEEVAAHWDRLVLRSFMTNANGRRVYQEGPAAKPARRRVSSPAGAGSILMTRAPRSASTRPAEGPMTVCENSRTFMPASGVSTAQPSTGRIKMS